MKANRVTTRARKSARSLGLTKQVTRSRDAASLSRLEAAANESARKALRDDVKSAKADKTKLRAQLVRERGEISRFLKKNPVYSSLQNEKNLDARIALMERNRPLLEKAYIGANIDSRSLTKAVRSILSPVKERILPLDLGNFFVVPPLPEVFSVFEAFELTAPYSSSDHEQSSSLIGVAEGTASNGYVRAAGAAAYDGEASCYSVLGDVISVPDGTTILHITASFNLNYSVKATGIADVASSACRIVLEVTDPNGKQTHESDLVARVVAPILWYAKQTGSGNFQITRSMTVPGRGGDFLVRAGVKIIVWAAGVIGGADADISGTVDRISVEAVG